MSVAITFLTHSNRTSLSTLQLFPYLIYLFIERSCQSRDHMSSGLMSCQAITHTSQITSQRTQGGMDELGSPGIMTVKWSSSGWYSKSIQSQSNRSCTIMQFTTEIDTKKTLHQPSLGTHVEKWPLHCCTYVTKKETRMWANVSE